MISIQVFEAIAFAVMGSLFLYGARELAAWFWRGLVRD